MKRVFPPMMSGQILGEEGGQVLDGALADAWPMNGNNPCALASSTYPRPFDTVSHASVATYLAKLGPRREAHLMLTLVIGAKVRLSFCGVEWDQRLERGIVQRAPHSAELFARVVDSHLGTIHMQWQQDEETWLTRYMCHLLLALYADDVVVLATTCQQLTRMIAQVQRCLELISLRLFAAESQVLLGPDVPAGNVSMAGQVVRCAHSFVYLGILMGFTINCTDVALHRITKAVAAFHGYYRILCRVSKDVQTRLRLFHTFVTSKWRWMSPGIRPTGPVIKMLNSLHLTYITSIARPAYDQFMSSTSNWIARRRAARIIAHQCRHDSWGLILARQFWSYWGHAARLAIGTKRPIGLTLEIHGVRWTMQAEGTVRRQVGYWPNAVRFLQLAWSKISC